MEAGFLLWENQIPKMGKGTGSPSVDLCGVQASMARLAIRSVTSWSRLGALFLQQAEGHAGLDVLEMAAGADRFVARRVFLAAGPVLPLGGQVLPHAGPGALAAVEPDVS